jgi:hypothetical protein
MTGARVALSLAPALLPTKIAALIVAAVSGYSRFTRRYAPKANLCDTDLLLRLWGAGERSAKNEYGKPRKSRTDQNMEVHHAAGAGRMACHWTTVQLDIADHISENRPQ